MKYFLSEGNSPAREVSVIEYCRAERRCGFYPKVPVNSPAWDFTPATTAFARSGICGWVSSESERKALR